jgi:hypothetical protein
MPGINDHLKFQTRWDKTVFWGSIAGCIIILFLALMKKDNVSDLKKENDYLKKRWILLKT